MDLLLITQNNCSGCEQLKSHLKSDEVPYVELNISNKPEAIDEYNVMGAPTLILLDEDEELTRVTGYNKEKVDEIVLVKQENE